MKKSSNFGQLPRYSVGSFGGEVLAGFVLPGILGGQFPGYD